VTDRLRDLPAVTEEVIALLERSAQIDSVSASPDEEVQTKAIPRAKKRRNRNRRSKQNKTATSIDHQVEEVEEAELAVLASARDHMVEALPPSNVAAFRTGARSKN
jgi:hypothetical protein